YEEGFGYKDTTKTISSKRSISINSRTVEIFKKIILENKMLKRWNSSYVDRGFIFTTKKGNPLCNNQITGVLKKTTKALNMNKKVTTHTFRHTHITLLVEMNVSLKAIMKRVGHVDEKTTIRIYTHVTEKMDRELTQKLENIPS
ncbi:TPA: tyrosine-type recombinase/integrase, partial [Staphylococcus aureus]|nr:tyrosine-type recombinase/integrase [Staphylococcus aureus]